MKTRKAAVSSAVCGLMLALCLSGCALISDPRPEGIADAAADALATRMAASVDAEAWRRTGAITWTYSDKYTHLWDRERQLARVQKDGWEVLVDVRSKQGLAFEDGVALEGAARDEAVQTGYAAWVNDSFWLTAMNKAFDPGATRARVTQPDGSDALLVTYSTGGVTPGDAYLWHFDDNGRPTFWQMWVSIVSIGGLRATWEQWVELPTGAWVSTSHRVGPLNIQVTDLDAAETLGELVPGPDPFARILDAQ